MEVEIPLEQTALRKEGDPENTLRLLAILRASEKAPVWVPPTEVRDPADPVDEPGYINAICESAEAAADEAWWEQVCSSSSSDDDDGAGTSGAGGMGEVINLGNDSE